mgnify:FL=1|tara:strand:+ start:340 stop:753 length:414 start_codon:yes stop_codon:yes gene_type:complete
MNKFLIGLLSMIVFAIIDSSIFIFTEDKLDNVLIENTSLDANSRPILLGGISAAVAILCASNLEHCIRDKYKIQSSAFLDFAGVIIGTCIVVIGYTIFKSYGGLLHVFTRTDRDKNKDHIVDNKEEELRIIRTDHAS